MPPRPYRMKRALAAAALAVALAPAGAMVRGTTESGRNFVSGGIGSDEVAVIQRERGQYALAILTAAKGSGAFLADIHIRITDAHATLVLETIMDGPWLLVDLPAGRYTVEATLEGSVQKTALTLVGGSHHQATFYFDTHDKITPAGQDPSGLDGS